MNTEKLDEYQSLNSDDNRYRMKSIFNKMNKIRQNSQYFKQTKAFENYKTQVYYNCVIYWQSAQLGSKKEIQICKYIKYDVSALTWVKISTFLVYREVLIY